MKIKCVCGKKIIYCNPTGDCWCKTLQFKLKRKELNKTIKKCICEDCLIKEYKLH